MQRESKSTADLSWHLKVPFMTEGDVWKPEISFDVKEEGEENEEKKERAKIPRIPLLVMKIKDAGLTGELSIPVLAETLSISRANIYHRMDDLVERGWADKVRSGVYTVHSLTKDNEAC